MKMTDTEQEDGDHDTMRARMVEFHGSDGDSEGEGGGRLG